MIKNLQKLKQFLTDTIMDTSSLADQTLGTVWKKKKLKKNADVYKINYVTFETGQSKIKFYILQRCYFDIFIF